MMDPKDDNGSIPLSPSKNSNQDQMLENELTEQHQRLIRTSLMDPLYRRRLLHTSCIFCAFIMLGWFEGLKGPILPDLQLVLDVDLETISWIFTTTSAGFLVGALISLSVLTRFSNVTLMTVSIISTAAAAAAIPWCTSLSMMLTVMFVLGFFSVILGSGGNAKLVSIWGKASGTYLHALNFSYSVGSIVSPLAVEPFLAVKSCTSIPTAASQTSGYTSEVSQELLHSLRQNNVTMHENVSQSQCRLEYGETRIYYIFIITPVLICLTAVPFIIMSIRTSRQRRSGDHIKREMMQYSQIFDRQTPCIRFLILLTLCSVAALNVTMESVTAGFLMTFVLTQLQWTKAAGSVATSVNWATFACGRLCGIFLGHCLDTSNLLFFFGSLRVCAFILLLISTTIETIPLIWLSIGLLGFANSLMFPATFAWCTETITPVTTRISALIFMACAICIMTIPVLFGYLMKTVSSMWYVYLLITLAALWIIIFFIVFTMSRHYLREIILERDLT